MRKVVLTMAGLAALVTTSVAVAHGIEGAKTAKAVAATFSASAGTTTSRTCTTTDGKTITLTDGKYTGTAAGDADMAGAITLRVRSVINTTDKVGTVNGAFRIDVSGRDTTGAFSTVYDNGSIAGLATGRAHTMNIGTHNFMDAVRVANAPDDAVTRSRLDSCVFKGAVKNRATGEWESVPMCAMNQSRWSELYAERLRGVRP